jgi:hypothetical protein
MMGRDVGREADRVGQPETALHLTGRPHPALRATLPIKGREEF